MKKFLKCLVIILIILACIFLLQTKNFNGFKLAHFYEGRTKASRDFTQKYDGECSYKIESEDYNDFMIYKTLKVQKNTAYKVSCMVKTENIEPEKNNFSGFNIGLKDRLEKSESIMGTNDWTKLEFYFNSYNNESVDIAFRLGDNDGNCKGKAWFANIVIESGRKKYDNTWDIAVFMINNTNATYENKNVSEKLTLPQANAIKNSLEYFKSTMQSFSNNEIKINYDIINIDEELKSISYDKETGYFVAPSDAYELIDSYLSKKSYDHIFLVTNIGDIINGNKLDWLGLGGMLYNSIGYSNIRISDNTVSSYKNSAYNYFPEEILVHEFLHTLERNSKQMGYETIMLHDYEKYGYKNEARYGQKTWYRDYMQKKINGNKGLEKEVFHTQPVSEKNFVSKGDVTNLLYDNQNFLQRITETISKI